MNNTTSFQFHVLYHMKGRIIHKPHQKTLLPKYKLFDMMHPMLNPDSDPQVDLIKVMVESYMKIVGKNFRDMTPKYIMLKLVEHVRLTNLM